MTFSPSKDGRARGATPFHLVVQNTGRGGTGEPVVRAAQRRIIELMLMHKASASMKDGRGKSVLEWATSGEIRQLLCGNV